MNDDILSVVSRKMQFPLFMKPVLLACALFFPALGSHAGNLIKWVDSEGRVHYSDQVPPEYAKQQKKYLNEQGMTIKTIEAAKTREQIEEEKRQAKLEQERKEKDKEQKAKDRVLLLTYQSVEHIISSRNNKLTTIDNTIQITLTTLRAQEEKLGGLLHSAAEFERAGKTVPKHLLDQIRSARGDIEKTNAFINSKKQEKELIQKEFDAYVRRYKELTEDKAP